MRLLVRTVFFSILVLIPILAKSQTVGLVLSGGGMRGFAHIGVIRALEENNIPINYITGTSSGALIGALYSVGYTPDEMERLVTSPAFIKLAQGIFDEEHLYYFKNNQPDASWATIKFFIDSVLHTQLPSNVVNTAEIDFELMEILSSPASKAGYNFDSLMIPFRCVATDITNKKSVLFRNGDLAMAVRASMAFPFYYSPVLLGNKILYDGGIYNNFPVDVMLSEFNPDVIIGSNAASVPDVPTEGNFLTQIRTMLSQTTVYQVPRPNDFLIEPEIKHIGSFDFDRIKIAIDSGYFSTLQIMDSIKLATTNRMEKETLLEERNSFKQNNEYSIDQVYVHGLNENQSSYVQKVINPANGPFSMEQFRKGYFMLVADDNFRYIYPHLLSNPQTGKYDLHLDVKQDKTIRVDLGANFSSRPINTGYIGFRYNFLSRQSFRLNTNLYFGKLYNSVHAKIRWDIPGKKPIYIEPSLTINQWDFYKSSSAFFEDVKPSFVVSYDRSYALHAGIPVRNKGKVIAGLNQFRLNNRYYQTRSFSVADTADLTRFDGMSLYIDFERNTLNRKMYANLGTYFNIRFRYIVGTEKTIPGSTNVQRDAIKKNHDWPQFTFTYDNYFKRWGALKLGFYSELNFSGQPFFANYTSSMISSPAFYPTQESRTLFLDNFRSHNYIGAGLKQVWSIFTNVDLRAEAYIFQPFQAIRSNIEDQAVYDEAFKNRYFIGTLNTVYNSPIGPVSISLNYYDDRDKPFTIMFHLGYIIFNKRALH